MITAALNEFGSRNLVPTRIANCASLSPVHYQVNDVEFLFQTSEQRLEANKPRSGRRPIIAPVYLRIFFEKIVESAVNGANSNGVRQKNARAFAWVGSFAIDSRFPRKL